MARPSNAPARRAQIVTAAIQLIGRSGFGGASTGAIARAAGLAPGLIHYHFADKRSILLAVVETLAATARARFEARLKAAVLPPLQAWVEARLGLGADADLAAVAAWVMIGREAISDQMVRAAYQGALEQELALLQQLLEAQAQALGKDPSSCAALALSALSFAEGCFALASATRNLVPAGFAAVSLQALLDAAIAAWPAAARSSD